MKTLLIYPEKAENRKSLAARLGLQLKKEHSDPIELVEISIELPITWERKILDLNEDQLKEKDIRWADLIFIRAEAGQGGSVELILKKCRPYGKKIIAMGSMFRSAIINFDKIDHLILNESELPRFTYDLENKTAEKIYGNAEKRSVMWLETMDSSLTGFSGNLQRSLQLVS